MSLVQTGLFEPSYSSCSFEIAYKCITPSRPYRHASAPNAVQLMIHLAIKTAHAPIHAFDTMPTQRNAKLREKRLQETIQNITLQVCDHSIVLLLILMHDTQKTCIRYSDALEVAVFACQCVSDA